MASELKKIPGLDVHLMDGNKGEFSVSLDGREVSRKGAELPSVQSVVSAVEQGAQVQHFA